MRKPGTFFKPAPGRSGSFGVLVCLVLAFLLPTVCLVWFMVEAMRNERLAVRERLLEAYSSTLQAAMGQAEQNLFHRYTGPDATRLWNRTPWDSPPLAFVSALEKFQGDGLVLLSREGAIEYPDTNPSAGEETTVSSPVWEEAVRLEEDLQDFSRAARLYGEAAALAGDDFTVRARALQAQVRSLQKDGQTTAALAVLTGPLSETSLAGARDTKGRLIQPASWLLALDLLRNPADPRFVSVQKNLVARLREYGPPDLPASQRLFLMEAYRRLVPAADPFPTFKHEQLARLWVDNGGTVSLRLPVSAVTLDQGVWTVPGEIRHGELPARPAALLYKAETLRRALTEQIGKQLPRGVRVEVHPPGDHAFPLPVPPAEKGHGGGRDPLLAMRFGSRLKDWTAALYPTPQSPLSDGAAGRASLYLWVGVLAISSVAGIVLLGGRAVLRQARLARLKNDLTATVTHELKTPVSSMRLLVDTLREDPHCPPEQRTEYLDLIARENARLSRLIDNFLTFSRMERNRQTFVLREVNVPELVESAVEAAGDRMNRPMCQLDVSVEEDLPPVIGDQDALVTVLLNLLENAWKYTGEKKEIALVVRAAADDVSFEVRDNGIGIPPRARKRIFERFYQVDQTLARGAGGCGLGLSIVDFIVKGHGGRIFVESEPGCGSTFTVFLPAARRTPAKRREEEPWPASRS